LWFNHLLDLRSDANLYKFLNAAQLIKHYMGLARCIPLPVVLLYLYWEPVNWSAFDEFHQHKEDLKRFATAVHGEDEVTFQSKSYDDLWIEWGARLDTPWLSQHITRLQERYSVKI
jgi:hypothetical protein